MKTTHLARTVEGRLLYAFSNRVASGYRHLQL
nr:MAG TPA: hypothetical protein [Caudoviricetes sp.]